MDEHQWIARIAARSPVAAGIGIGDDAALLSQSWNLCTVDTLVEGVHFRCDWSTWFDIGYKLVTANLSDIAAMGGVPGPRFLALSVGPSLKSAGFDCLLDGMEASLRQHDVAGCLLHGGDTTRIDGPSVLSVTQLGSVHTPIRMSGLVAGDVIAVAGRLGLSSLGLAALSRGREGLAPICVAAHRRPTAQSGALVQSVFASAATDVSDGLGVELAHLARASSVRIRVKPASRSWLCSDLVRECAQLGEDPWSHFLGGGEDFALVFGCRAEEVPEGVVVVGDVVEGGAGVEYGCEVLERAHRGYVHCR